MPSLHDDLKSLICAIEKRDAEACRTVLYQRPDLVFHRIALGNNRYTYALHLAASTGNLELGKIFLYTLRKLGKEPDFLRDASQNTAHHHAASYGHESFVRMLIEHGGSAFVRNAASILPIHDAARFGHISLLRLYATICSPAILTDTDEEGNTPLHYAAANGQLLAVKTILELASKHALHYPELLLLYAMVNHEGLTPYDITCRRLQDPAMQEQLQRRSKEQLKLIAQDMHHHGADIHGPVWRRPKSDA